VRALQSQSQFNKVVLMISYFGVMVVSAAVLQLLASLTPLPSSVGNNMFVSKGKDQIKSKPKAPE